MSIAQIRRRIAATSWYKQGSAMRRLYGSYPWDACYGFTAMGRRVAINYRGVCAATSRTYMEFFFPTKVLARVADFYRRRFRSRTTNPFRQRAYWQRTLLRPFVRRLETIERSDLRILSDTALRTLFRELSSRYIQVWRECIFLDSFDYAGDAILHETLRSALKRLCPGDTETLTAPQEPTSTQHEAAALAGIARRILRRPTIHRAIVRGTPYTRLVRLHPDIGHSLDRHADQFSWIQNDYAQIEQLRPAYFFAKLRALLRHPDAIMKAKASLRTAASAHVRREHTMQRLRLPLAQRTTLRSLMELSAWRDERKSFQQRASGSVNMLAREYARRFQRSLSDIEDHDWWELDRACTSGLLSKRDLTTRRGAAFTTQSPRVAASFIRGPQAQLLIRHVHAVITRSGAKALAGTPACSGIVHGRARVIRSKAEFGSMRAGEILITSNTRPEFVPIMKKASAIVTEEGGLTSHAAIVSRELGIPSVVGVQGILGRITTGSRMRVDADHGIITLL